MYVKHNNAKSLKSIVLYVLYGASRRTTDLVWSLCKPIREAHWRHRWSQVPADVDHSSVVFSCLRLFVFVSARSPLDRCGKCAAIDFRTPLYIFIWPPLVQ